MTSVDGGSRSQQPTWVLFFDDVDAIIFLVHISTFDQALTEDYSVNCLKDSALLWKSICSNPLLAKVDLILFLNKCDMLMRKLEAGMCLSESPLVSTRTMSKRQASTSSPSSI